MRTAFNPIGVTMNNKLFAGMIITAVLDFAPDGWLICNGASYLTNEYNNLFNAIGYKFGGTGENFNVPDYRGLLLQMVTGNQQIGTNIEAGLPNITGNYIDLDGFAPQNKGEGVFQQTNSNKTAGYTGASLLTRTYSIMNFDASRSNSIYGKSDTVQPPVSLINYFIKY